MANPILVWLLADPLSRYDEAVSSLREEHDKLAEAQNTDIASLLEVGEEHSRAFIAQDHRGGTPLLDALKGDKRAITLAAAEQGIYFLRALSSAHKHGVLHLDIKPELMFVRESGVSLAGFGMRHFLPPFQPARRNEAFYGTPEFMAPELCSGKGRTLQSDVYSVAIVLYSIVAGKPPFASSNVNTVLKRQIYEKPLPLHLVKPGTPHVAELEKVISKALQKDPKRRFASADEFLDALTSFYEKAGGTLRSATQNTAGSAHASEPAPSATIPMMPAVDAGTKKGPSARESTETHEASASTRHESGTVVIEAQTPAAAEPAAPAASDSSAGSAPEPEAAPEPTLISKPSPLDAPGRTSTLIFTGGGEKKGKKKKKTAKTLDQPKPVIPQATPKAAGSAGATEPQTTQASDVAASPPAAGTDGMATGPAASKSATPVTMPTMAAVSRPDEAIEVEPDASPSPEAETPPTPTHVPALALPGKSKGAGKDTAGRGADRGKRTDTLMFTGVSTAVLQQVKASHAPKPSEDDDELSLQKLGRKYFADESSPGAPAGAAGRTIILSDDLQADVAKVQLSATPTTMLPAQGAASATRSIHEAATVHAMPAVDDVGEDIDVDLQAAEGATASAHGRGPTGLGPNDSSPGHEDSWFDSQAGQAPIEDDDLFATARTKRSSATLYGIVTVVVVVVLVVVFLIIRSRRPKTVENGKTETTQTPISPSKADRLATTLIRLYDKGDWLEKNTGSFVATVQELSKLSPNHTALKTYREPIVRGLVDEALRLKARGKTERARTLLVYAARLDRTHPQLNPALAKLGITSIDALLKPDTPTPKGPEIVADATTPKTPEVKAPETPKTPEVKAPETPKTPEVKAPE
ncbi:MAG: protein kinase, partial [Myxococcales bacterium]|nr:protein kinase [Myxococcales bacterium]